MTQYFSKYADAGFLILRLAFGFQLIYGTHDNVFSAERMLEFEKFLTGFHVPLPGISAAVSAYVQFICGILLIVGWQTRLAGLFIAINFVFALIIAHRGDVYTNMAPAINLLAAGLFFLFAGAGKWSVDAVLKSRIK